jgi:AraC-like DNA-binding protein
MPVAASGPASPPMLPSSSVSATIGPLVELLRRELTLAGIAPPRSEPASIREFTLWYLDAVQLLEAHCAAEDDHPAMARDEVELMCRVALSGRTLEEAIGLCIRFTGMLYPRAGRCELVVEHNIAFFSMDSLRHSPTTASSLVDITGLFAFRQLFQWLAGIQLQLLQVGIGPVARENVLPFLRLFNTAVLTGGERYTMEFPAEALQFPVIRGVGEFSDFFSVFPCGIFEDTRRTLAEQVASLITASLRLGSGVPTQNRLAFSLGLPLSTFRSRLAKSGTTFRQLRESCLLGNAHEHLARADLSINDIAARLGFSDAGAFRRAFRQWTGTTPTAWRQDNGSRKDY